MTRFLRPSPLVVAADSVWAIDVFQPVAARLDRVDGCLSGIVAWPDVPPQPVGCRRHMAAHSRCVWIQQGEIVAFLDADGVRWTTTLAGVTLHAAGGPGAWFAEVPHIAVGGAGPDGTWLSAPPLPDGRVVLVTPGGSRWEFRLDRPVRAVAAAADGLLVTVADRPPDAIPVGRGGFAFDYHYATYRVPWSTLRGEAIVCTEQTRVETPPYGLLGWLRPKPGAGWRVDGLWWSVGWDPRGSKIERALLAVGVDEEGVERARVPLGTGTVTAACRVEDRIWLTVSRGRFLHVDADAPAEVVVLDPAARAVKPVLGPDAVDITERTWPLPPAPRPGALDHAQRWLDRFGGLDAYWTDEAGATKPLTGGMTDVSSTLDGEWPDLAVRVAFRHPHFPAGRLSRRIPLFDELGRPVEPEYADIALMEDLDTGYLPPVTEAVEGVLRI
jgi:hypothetical protein